MKKTHKGDAITCERCGEVLLPKRVKWLELSINDGNYYEAIPDDHVSQGGFAFGSICAKKQIQETNEILNTENK